MESHSPRSRDKLGWRQAATTIAVIALIPLVAAIIWSIYWKSLGSANMSQLIHGEPHPRLMRVELHSGPVDAVKPALFTIEDTESLNYLDSRSRPKGVYSGDLNAGALYPIDVTFVFGDGSRYRTTMTIPNKPGRLGLTYPYNKWQFFDDWGPDVYLVIDSTKTRDLDKLFRWAKAY